MGHGSLGANALPAHLTNLRPTAIAFVQCNNSGLGIVQCTIAPYMNPYTQHSRTRRDQRGSEMSDVQKFGEEFQRVGKNGFDAAVQLVW